jgi:hypothetical protein
MLDEDHRLKRSSGRGRLLNLRWHECNLLGEKSVSVKGFLRMEAGANKGLARRAEHRRKSNGAI